MIEIFHTNSDRDILYEFRSNYFPDWHCYFLLFSYLRKYFFLNGMFSLFSSFNTNNFFSLDDFKWNYCLFKINFTEENDEEIHFENEIYFDKRCSLQLFTIIDVVDWISSCFRCNLGCNSNIATSSTWYCRIRFSCFFGSFYLQRKYDSKSVAINSLMKMLCNAPGWTLIFHSF